MRWKDGIIIALISFAMGFVVGWHPTFASVRNFVITGLSVGIIASVVFQVIGLFIERHKEKEAKRKTHSKLLSTALQSLTKKLNLSTLPIQSNTSSQKYSTEVEEHLKSGYLKESWRYKKERDHLISSFNHMVQDFVKNTTDKIKSEINQRVPSLIEWNGKGKPPTKYFSSSYFFSDVEGVVLSSYNQPYDIDRYCVILRVGTEPINGEYLKNVLAKQYGISRWKLTITHEFAESDNENEILVVKQTIATILKDALMGESFVKIKKYYEDINSNDELFVKSIESILKYVENEVPLKGTCEICRNF